MLNVNEIDKARKQAEKQLGFEIPTSVADYILGYTIRKFLMIISKETKPEGYFGVLYQNEIIDHYTREAVSFFTPAIREERAYVFSM